MKAFRKQRIPESSYVIKKAVDIDIPVTSRNSDKNNMQTIRTKSETPTRLKSGTS